MLKRFLIAVLLFAAAGRAAAVDYSDIWFIPAEAGWGVNVVQSDFFMFLTFFIYGSDGKPTWFTGQITRDASGNFNGTLYSTTGTYYFLPWAGFMGGPVGTVSFQPLGPYTATLIYTVSGIGTVTKSIQRQNLTAITIGGAYSGAQSATFSGCTSNYSFHDFFNLQITQPNNTMVTFSLNYPAYTNYTCTFSGMLEHHGQLYNVPAAASQCTGESSASTVITELKATGQGVEGRFTTSYGGGCQLDAQFSAVRQ
jgi:hypothetical protein